MKTHIKKHTAMKKTAFTIAFAAAFLCAAAQDTVRYPDEWYGYTPRAGLYEFTGIDTNGYIVRWGFDSATIAYEPLNRLADPYKLFYPPFFNGEVFILQQGYVIPLAQGIDTLYGMAVTIDEVDLDSLEEMFYVFTRTSLTPFRTRGWDSSIVYAHFVDYDSMYMYPTVNPPLVKQCRFEYDYTVPTESRCVSNCYEFYFDKPLAVAGADSVFVGLSRTFASRYRDKIHIGRDTSRSQRWYYSTISLPIEHDRFFQSLNALLKWFEYIVDDTVVLHEPYYANASLKDAYWIDCYWGGVFPIVKRRCTAPRGLHLGYNTADGVDTALWRSDTNAAVFQLSICPPYTSPGSGTLVTTAGNSHVLPPLESSADKYCVYLRKMCTFSYSTTGRTDTVWSDWSGPMVVDSTHAGLIDSTYADTTGTGGDTTGIAEVDCPGLALEVSPNPTAGRVTVACGEPMELLEVYDTKGALLRRATPASDRATLDLSALPAGTYLLRVTTPQAVASRKLVRY